MYRGFFRKVSGSRAVGTASAAAAVRLSMLWNRKRCQNVHGLAVMEGDITFLNRVH